MKHFALAFTLAIASLPAIAADTPPVVAFSTNKTFENATKNLASDGKWQHSENRFHRDDVFISSVPEPETDLMLLVGLAFVGYRIGRRK